MLFLCFGCLGFLLFLLHDLNGLLWERALLRPAFLVGCVLLAGSTTALFLTAPPRFLLPSGARAAVGILGLLFLFLLIYSLFFALPFKRTYLEESAARSVYDRGMYALCRHPGVLWFLLFYLCGWLWSGADQLFWAWILFGLLNVGYIVLQDRWIFPKTFDHYGDYRGTTPFLIPTPASIRRCVSTMRA